VFGHIVERRIFHALGRCTIAAIGSADLWLRMLLTIRRMKDAGMIPAIPETALRRTRLFTGLVMFTFVAMHMANHALALISLQTAEQGREWFSLVWLNPVSSVLFYGSMLIHVMLALRAIYQHRTLRMPVREALQIGLGLLIPFLLVEHATGIRFSRMLYGIDLGYEAVIRKLWITYPIGGVKQTVTLLVIWAHACIGVFFWLRYRDWYSRVAPYLLTLAVLLPVLALLGFSDAGRMLEKTDQLMRDDRMITDQRIRSPTPRNTEMEERLDAITRGGQVIFIGSVLSVFLLRGVRRWRQKSTGIEIRYQHGALVRVPPDLSVLEASRIGGVPHYAVCGGKGRCSTCRVRIIESDGPLPEPGAIELATLRRIHADQDVRLGCQLRPKHNLSVALLLSPTVETDLPVNGEPARPGREEEIAILFCDLRNFTALSEARLPYDVVFLLNRYFAIVGQAVEQAGGRLDKFIGDGAMALFGIDGNSQAASRDAMKAAANIIREIGRLNAELEKEFSVELRVAIGVHTGPSIVGVMGYGSAKSLTAIGDTVNVASRLESLAKDFDTSIVVSEPAIVQAQAEIKDLENRKITIRGRTSAMKVYLLSQEQSARYL
jgi:adenylate cyclase